MEEASKSLKGFAPDAVTLIGIPSDENSSFLPGCAQAPKKIREVLHNGASNLYTERGVNLEDESVFCDCGDLKFGKGKKGFDQIEAGIIRLKKKKAQILSIGGDHAITYPIIRGFSKTYSNLTVLHFDAHPDIYDEFEGNRLSHACPFARIMEEKLISRLVQVGIRSTTDHIQQQYSKFGIEVIEARDFQPDLELNLTGPLYISLDLDVFDPAFAPGISHHEPGGLSVRDVLTVIQNINVPIVGADVVEYNPTRDISDMTAMVAVKFVKELAGKMISQNLLGNSKH